MHDQNDGIFDKHGRDNMKIYNMNKKDGWSDERMFNVSYYMTREVRPLKAPFHNTQFLIVSCRLNSIQHETID